MVKNYDECKEMLNEIENTFGDCPEQVENLVYISLCKNLAQTNNVKRVVINSETARLYLYKEENILNEHLHKKLELYKNDFVLKFENLPIIELTVDNLSIKKKLLMIATFLA